MSTSFQPVGDLHIGRVVEVSGTTLKVELSGDVMELTRTHQGRVYPIGQMGSVVKVHFGRRLVFGFVTLLRMRSEELIEGQAPVPAEADQRVMEVELFAEGSWDQQKRQLQFRRGVSTYPLPRQGVYLLSREEAAEVYRAAEGQPPSDGTDPRVHFASYVGADNARCHANIDKMFGMHCAILGSTGSGKSGAVAAVLHAVLDHLEADGRHSRPKIIVIDPHGEYASAFRDRGIVFRAYDPIGSEETEGENIRLPYWLMTADEFRQLVIGKTEHGATSQHNVIYKALAHARMVSRRLVNPAPSDYESQQAPLDGGPLDEPRPADGHTANELADFDPDRPIPFCLDEVARHIEFLQAARAKAPGKSAEVERVAQTDFSNKYKSILDKLRVLRIDPRIRFIMENLNDDAPTLRGVLKQLVGPPRENKKDLRIIDISGLPNEVAGPLTALIARLLFQYKLYQAQNERTLDPVLLVCEEAHRYVPNRGEAQYAAAQEAVRRIAREGRKYGLGLMLVSQRPSDIESTVIAQCGTWLVLRLTNSADQEQVAKFLPDGLSGMTRALPALAQQEALFVGEGAALPARVRIRDLSQDRLPRSNTVSFASGWAGEGPTEEQIRGVAARMDGSAPPSVDP